MISLFASSAAAATGVVERIVAVVNDEIITSYELDSAFEPMEKRIEATYRGPNKERLLQETRLDMLKKMVDKLLLEQEAKKTGIVVKDEEVMDTIRDIARRQNVSMDALKQALAKEGTTLEAYRNEIREQMVRMRILRRDVRSKIAISEEEIGAYYLKHREDYEGKEAVRIKQILLPYPGGLDEEGKKKLREQAETIRQRIIAGESFDLMAATYSQGPAAAQGGDLGFIEKGLMLPEVDRVAFSLKQDEVSELVESSLGLHLLKLVDKRGAGVKPIEAVRQEIVDRLEEGKLEVKYEDWMEGLRKRSHIEIRL
jgi:parvulin-like peptidyl-prolyl isomerase